MTIEAQIRDYLAHSVLFTDGAYDYEDDASFLEEGIVDSVAVMELALFVEETFGINIEDADITPDNFDSVTKLANYIRRKQAVLN
ncbi:MAG TPA: acyl carrier protein [Aggregatilinea sp.]|uniref:acyl carrier protein n=1 Tax=Aggregatilinea sp. TaxID=2806333 RepID=UPI002CB71A50|nr:acyl carrier protein [Aggregatilinea sp.]HML20717.1 acyl carrier protein [Aggregatilinea sp.]